MPTQPKSTPEVEAIFRRSMAALAAGVSVVTGMDPDGSPCGLTVTSLASYSANPPSVIVCVDESCNSYGSIATGKHFAVNLLHAGQPEVAKLFASGAADKFDHVNWTVWNGCTPLLVDALGVIICSRATTTVHGDHAIVIGDVIDGSIRQAPPLVYWNRNFHEGPGHLAGSERQCPQ